MVIKNGIVYLTGMESCEFYIYFGGQTIVWGVSLANVFSHMIGSLFILMIYSVAEQKLFSLI